MQLLVRLSQYIILSYILFLNQSYADEDNFPQPTNFHLTSEDAKIKNIPIMVLFSSVYCDYCKFIKEEFLNPMIKSGDYVDKVIIRVVEDDQGDEVIDFNDKLIESGSFSDRYEIVFIPTILFIDSNGKELADRVVGLGNVEYFGGFIDDAIENSQLKINLTLVGSR
ncbi:MAG: thioredoxin family protein [Proteobacteria bacterium]|nr:thioredoxin family protein [Pseudomonadota bacterium]